MTRVSKNRLARWDRAGFFSPEIADEADRGSPYSRVYSFNDLVGLRVLAVLADKYRVPYSELKAAHDILKAQAARPWSEIRVTVANRKIVIFDEHGHPVNVTDGQYSFHELPLPEIAKDVAERAQALRKRDNDQIGVIERHKYVARNAPVMAGTRIPVAAIESFIDAGYDDAGIVAEYPGLTPIDISTVRNRMKVAA
ncbi:MAG: DUF433 domain-containing protein [Proteobacteria bacterium]|nr:DUF433 domain-containing protein [Pseudomonadota bacterium]